MACKGSGVQIPSAPHWIMKKFLYETKELITSQGLIAVLAIVQVRIVATNLGPEDYGIIGIYLGIIALCFRILNSRNSDLVLINSKSTNKEFTSSAIYFEIMLGAVSFFVVYLILFFSPSNYFFNFTTVPNYLIFYIFTRIFFNIFEVFRGVFTYKGDMKTYSFVESFSNIIRFSLVVIMISVDTSIKSFFYALSIHQMLISLIIFVLLLKNINKKKESIKFLDYFNLSKTNFYKIRTDQAIGLIPTHLDVVIIGFFADFYSAGIYRIAKKLIDPINYLIVAFSPWMLNKINEEESYSFKRLTYNILIPIAVSLIIFYYFFGELFIELIAGKEFLDAYIPMLILLVGFLSYFLTFWTRHFLFLNNLIFKHTIGRIINLLAFLFTSPYLITYYGFNGIALSISIAVILQKIYELFVYSQNRSR